MNKLQARLTPIAAFVQAKVGDAFNLGNLVQLFSKAEEINEMTPQLAEASDYAKYIPVAPTNSVIGGGEILSRKRGIGEGKDHSGTGGDIPLAEVEYDTVNLKVVGATIGYTYSIFEIETALAAGISLDGDKVQAARLAAEKHLSRIAWEGNAAKNLKGFYNQTGVDIVTAQADWATGTIEEVLGDFNTALNGALTDSEFDASITPDTFLLPSNKYTTLATRVVPDSGGKTFLKYIEENNILASQGKTLTIRGLGRGNGKGAGGTDRAVIYRRDPSCIQFKCDEVEFLAAQPVGVDIKIPGHYKYQGVWLKRVDSFRYMDI
ncbi:DUF2184 domain-containing protein [Acinetobacter sp. B51(2017)]|uniref:DUF2184 domain-containing protein n=1 Tax=Acinetobacter sp. B51(2017) TaxID=2060938 RepID=UPI000F07B4CC|nr:DUF2184 domain-containing protein [Acinetobacter sp. B51(2017)]